MQVDSNTVTVDYARDMVKSKDSSLLVRVEKAVARLRQAMGPCSNGEELQTD